MPRHYLLERADRVRANRTGDVRHDLALFVELLRSIGVGVSSGSSLQAMQALAVVRLDDIRDFRAALDCCLSSCAEDRLLFDGIFEVFWSAEDTEVPALRGEDEGGGDGDTLRGAGELSAQTTEPAAQGRADRDGLTGHATYSRSRGQGSTVTAGHRREIDELSRRLARALGTAPGRRLVTGAHGDLVDLRASLRHNLRFGDEMLLLRHTTRRRDRPRIVVLCDVSSSMRPYTPLFLAFVHSLTKIVRGVESAVFNVELSMVTEVFRGTNLRQALEWLGHQQVALSGGTRIGHSLHSFLDNLEHRGVMRSDTIALILSDGWDVGDGELLQDGMRRLRDQAGRVVWCDPHAASTAYHPQVQGLRLALPFVDDYLDFSTVESLAQLVTRLEHRTPTPTTRLVRQQSLKGSSVSTMNREEFRVGALPTPLSHYTDAVRWGDVLFVSGCAPIGADGQVVAPGDVTAQARVVHEYLGAALRAAGTDFAHVLKVTVFLLDAADRHAVNEVRKEFFGNALPASTLIEVSALAIDGLLVEIEAIAGIPS